MRAWIGRPGFSLLLVLWACLAPVWAQDPEPREPQVTSQNQPDGAIISLDNEADYETTLTIEADLQNMHSEPAVPFTRTFPGHFRGPVARLIANPSGQWRWNYKYHWVIGTQRAHHDDSVVYALPFPSGFTSRVLQGYYGKFSHQDQAALDFDLPVGTPVLAAREGVVIATEDRFTRSGTEPADYFKRRTNYVIVRHSDGTYAEYLHLKPDGVAVRVGQQVVTGQLLGYSGNVGFTTGPHLHFMVAMAQDGNKQLTFPVRFRTAESSRPVEPEEGASYTAP